MAKSHSRATRLQEVMDNLQKEIEDAIETAKSTAVDGINELKDEIDNWKSGLEGTNLENSSKFSELEDCVSALEDLESEVDSLDASNIEIPDAGNVSFPSMY